MSTILKLEDPTLMPRLFIVTSTDCIRQCAQGLCGAGAALKRTKTMRPRRGA
jgi:hypothetical protein